jgi:hypothetical protein
LINHQKSQKKYKALVGLFFFCVFNPFVSPLPIGTDVQLPVFLLAFVLFIIASINGKVRIDKSQILLLLISMWTLAYLGLEGSFNPRYRLGLPLGILVLLVVHIYWQSLSLTVVYISIAFNSIGIISHKLFPQIFIPIAELVTREIKIKEIGSRGASGFCAEPGLASAMFIILLLTLVYLRDKKILQKKYFYLNSILMVYCILLTQSATGILFMVIIFFVFITFKMRAYFKIISITIIISIILYANSTDFFEATRSGALIVLFLTSPLEILRLDSSLAERAAGITFGLYGINEWLFGYGGGSYANVAPQLDSKYNVMNYYYTARDQTQQTVSAFGTYSLEFGIIFWIFLIVLLYYSFALSAMSLASLAIAFMFILASFSIAFPGIWYLIVLSTQYQKNRGNN